MCEVGRLRVETRLSQVIHRKASHSEKHGEQTLVGFCRSRSCDLNPSKLLLNDLAVLIAVFDLSVLVVVVVLFLEDMFPIFGFTEAIRIPSRSEL